MELEPKDLLEKLEFDKILALLEEECYGELGKEAVHRIPIETDRDRILNKLQEVFEFKQTIENNHPFPFAVYHGIEEDLRMLEVVDYVLPEESFKRISLILLAVRDIFSFFTPIRQETYPTLYQIMRPVHFDEALIEAIESVIDEEGNIRADASPGLLKIRKMIISKQKELEKVFRSLINSYRNKGWLTDNVESFRNGRRVLSVPAEHKRKIRGIIHDESTTGKTAFIEPEAVIDINNDIFDLYTEEKREIFRILKELSATLRPYGEMLGRYQQLLIRFDIIQAKAQLAVKLRATIPKLADKPTMGIQMGYHPLLFLKNKSLERETVPFDLSLHGANRILVLSGPNAGGKSITMKSVGLLQLMVQSGMLVPMDEISEMGIFKNIFADIGDQQSLEDDLSTYSSRLHNMRVFLEKSDKDSLLLIDEFGSGTDPKIGGLYC
jgi:DNA mismatch repair protein MutS2